jgi:hypothetical protein
MKGQPWTVYGIRGETLIENVSYRDLYKIVLDKLEYYHPDRCDPEAFCQDLCCRIEKKQGIFPNVQDME